MQSPLVSAVVTSVPIPPPETPALALTMAHFASADAARQFAEEFHTYLLPGQLDGPALAEAVAQVEGLPDAWTPHQPGRPLICEADDWHPHDPNAEGEARDPGITSNFDL